MEPPRIEHVLSARAEQALECLAILVDPRRFNFDGRKLNGNKFRRLFSVVKEVPQTDFVVAADTQLVISVVEVHACTANGPKLEERFLRHKIVLVDYIIHGEKEEITVRFTAHLNHVNSLVPALEGQFVIVNLNALGAGDAHERTVLKQVASLAHDAGVFQQDFLQHHELPVRL